VPAPAETAKPKKVSFLVFFLIWARRQGWVVPELHVRMCQWLEECDDPERVLMVFRGAAKSTLYAIYKAWKLYRDQSRRTLIWAADGPLATKLTRDTIHVLRRHPLCGGMLPPKPGQKRFWVNGASDPRNASMEAVGVDSNATGARADDVDFDDIEVPKNIKTPEARVNLRMKIEDSVHIAVPGAQKTFIGTPHTHDSIYTEKIAGGAAMLKIPLFEHFKRYETTDKAKRYKVTFDAGADGFYVFTGIGKFAKLLVDGRDYQVDGREIVFDKPPHAMLDIYAGNVWPERFTRKDLEVRRKGTKTLNAWDSQYMLEAKPVSETRLDPSKLRVYRDQPSVRVANNQVGMFLGQVRIVGAVAYWDCALGKINSDASAFTVVLTDDHGNLYWHICEDLMGELAEFDERSGEITGGQVARIVEHVKALQLPAVDVETNGPGGFVPPILRRALKGTGCAVREVHSVADKRKRILDAIEPPLSSRFLWVHEDVADGPMPEQMQDFNPLLKDQPDDYLDSGAGAITATPVRIGKVITAATAAHTRKQDWRPSAGVHEVEFEM
jgi:hypothetical protein